MATEDRKNLFRTKESALSFPLLFYEARQKRAARKKYFRVVSDIGWFPLKKFFYSFSQFSHVNLSQNDLSAILVTRKCD